jgi:hypothetical protein
VMQCICNILRLIINSHLLSSNGLVLPESDGFGQSLAMSGTLDP